MRSVEANVPYREWLRAARGGRSELAWLIERFDELPQDLKRERAELYDSQTALRALDTTLSLIAHGLASG